MIKNRRSFIVGLKSTSLLSKEKFFLLKYKPWGIILFSRNIKNLSQARKLTDDIRSIFKDKKYPILIDEEGGRVSRLKKIQDNSIFSGSFFGKMYVRDKKQFETYYKIFIDQTSFFLNKIGANINTVPVLDLKRKTSNNVIGDRSFSTNTKIISDIGNYCITNFKRNKIGTVIKHIPGHGLANVDSHLSTPIVKKSVNYLKKNDFLTFKKKQSFFAMTAHVIYRNIDKKYTATHSKKVIKLIRNYIKFKNIIISDDLSMKSLKFSIEENTIKSFDAGCNLVLHCNGKLKEMTKVAVNSPIINKFIIKKTSEFYKILS
jgi:beta-N-acetylhexosaminidase